MILKKVNNPNAQLLKALSICATLAAVTVPAYACQVPKSYYSNVFCTASNDHFLALTDAGTPVALINKSGRRVADLTRYNSIDVSKLNAGLVPVQRRGRVGYVSTSGREIIPAIYDVIAGDSQTKGWSRAVSNNRIVVKKGGAFGVIDTKNRVIVPFSRNNLSISDFKDNLARITTRNGTQWIDINGRPAADPTKAIANNNQAATVSSASSNASVTRSSTTASSTTQYPNPTQNSNVTQTAFSSSSYSEIWQPERRDGKWGFVNSNSVPMIKFLFEKVTPFSEGLAGVRMDNKWGFVNLAGELVIPFDFAESKVKRSGRDNYKGVEPFVFKDGKAWVGNNGVGAKMCIDTKGSYVSC